MVEDESRLDTATRSAMRLCVVPGGTAALRTASVEADRLLLADEAGALWLVHSQIYMTVYDSMP